MAAPALTTGFLNTAAVRLVTEAATNVILFLARLTRGLSTGANDDGDRPRVIAMHWA
jgi:hypothetical protein